MALLVDKMVTDEFVADIKRDSFMPAVQSQWTDQRILDVAWQHVLSVVAVPLAEAEHSFYREADDTTLVAGQSAYDVPRYAMMSKIHVMQLLDTNGQVQRLERIDPQDEWIWKSSAGGHPRRIRIDNLQIVIDPAPTAADILIWPTLRSYIYRRPGRMVRLTTSGSNTARAAQVSTAAGTLVTYTGNKPSDYSSSSVHDFYDGTSPFRRIGTAVTATASAASNTQGFAAGSVSLLTAGDFVCLRDETCVVPVPSHELLLPLQKVVIAAISATQGAKAAYETAIAQFTGLMQSLYPAAANRLQGNLAAMSLHKNPFLNAVRTGGRRMVSGD